MHIRKTVPHGEIENAMERHTPSKQEGDQNPWGVAYMGANSIEETSIRVAKMAGGRGACC